MNIIEKYFPGILNGGEYGCEAFYRYDFNRDNICTKEGEGRFDYNNDGVLDEKDDWILLEINRDQLGENSAQIISEAAAFWKKEQQNDNPEATRHLSYWNGTRRLIYSCEAIPITYNTVGIDEADQIGFGITPESDLAYLSFRIFEQGTLIDSREIGGLKSGLETVFKWPKMGDKRTFEFRASTIQKSGNQDILKTSSFTEDVWKPIRASDLDVDLPTNSLTFQHNQEIPLKKIVVSFWSEQSITSPPGGAEKRTSRGLMVEDIYDSTRLVQSGSQVQLRWNQIKVPHHKVKEIKMVIHDPHNEGFTETWWVPVAPIAIPHEEVQFQLDLAKPVNPNEVSNKVNPAISKVWGIAMGYPKHNFKLWVVGHTDRLGTEEHNLELSNERAKMIAEYFYLFLAGSRKPTDVPSTIGVYYTGVGESQTETADNVASPQDRKAEYYLSKDPPFASDWHKADIK